MNLYAQNILDHYKNPRHQGEMENPTITHSENNPLCGDSIELDLIFDGGSDCRYIKDLKFRGQGCAISQAAMSILSEELIGLSIAKATNISPKDILELLGIEISQRRMKCGLLSLLTIRNALNRINGMPLLKWSDLD